MPFKWTVDSRLDRLRMVGLPIGAREYDVLSLLIQGKSNDIIATALDVSEETVKVYITRLLAKTNTRTRGELAYYCIVDYLKAARETEKKLSTKVQIQERKIARQRKSIADLRAQLVEERRARCALNRARNGLTKRVKQLMGDRWRQRPKPPI